jgi:bifunctional non-homologous end joining protein LigD
MSTKKRRGRIFIDYLRNERGSTAIAPFSPRRRLNASVATPVSWTEPGRIRSANAFTIKTPDRRLKGLRSNPWEDYARASKQALSAAKIKGASA